MIVRTKKSIPDIIDSYTVFSITHSEDLTAVWTEKKGLTVRLARTFRRLAAGEKENDKSHLNYRAFDEPKA